MVDHTAINQSHRPYAHRPYAQQPYAQQSHAQLPHAARGLAHGARTKPLRTTVHSLNPTFAPLAHTAQRAGRRLLMGFSYLQRITKGGQIDVWFPASHAPALNEHGRPDWGKIPGPFTWAAVREIELLRDANNLAIEDLEAERLHKALLDIQKMRAGGYRYVVAVAGDYDGAISDDLATFDARLQEKLQHMVNIFWLEELAESAHQSIIHLIQQHGAWHYQHHVPHLGMVLGSLEMLQNSGALAKKFSHQALKRRVAESFLEALAPLPSGGDDAFTHDLFIGLKIPTLNDDKHWVYMPEDVYTARAFNSLMRDVFSSFDGINLGGLASDTGFGTTRETMATTQHLHGYQGRLGEQTRQNYAAMAGFFSP